MPCRKKDFYLSWQWTLSMAAFSLGLLGLLLFPAHLLAEEPFAPWVKLTAEGTSALQGQKVPSKTEVGIPAYPNAFLANLASITNKKNGNTVPVIHLVSPDSPDAIVSFYKTELSKMTGWKWDDAFEAFHMGESYTDAVDQFNSYMEITAVPANSEYLKYVDPSVKGTLKTMIQLVYNPKK